MDYDVHVRLVIGKDGAVTTVYPNEHEDDKGINSEHSPKP